MNPHEAELGVPIVVARANGGLVWLAWNRWMMGAVSAGR